LFLASRSPHRRRRRRLPSHSSSTPESNIRIERTSTYYFPPSPPVVSQGLLLFFSSCASSRLGETHSRIESNRRMEPTSREFFIRNFSATEHRKKQTFDHFIIDFTTTATTPHLLHTIPNPHTPNKPNIFTRTTYLSSSFMSPFLPLLFLHANTTMRRQCTLSEIGIAPWFLIFRSPHRPYRSSNARKENGRIVHFEGIPFRFETENNGIFFVQEM
jgi:hypothetical protein